MGVPSFTTKTQHVLEQSSLLRTTLGLSDKFCQMNKGSATWGIMTAFRLVLPWGYPSLMSGLAGSSVVSMEEQDTTANTGSRLVTFAGAATRILTAHAKKFPCCDF